MVRAWLPEHSFTAHPVIPDQNILNGVVDRMTHMQAPRHIGRRDDNRKIIIFGINRLGRAGLKRAAVFPHLIKTLFSNLRIEFIFKHYGYSIFEPKQKSPTPFDKGGADLMSSNP